MSENNFLNDRNVFSITDLFYTTSDDSINPNNVSRVYNYSLPNYYNEDIIPVSEIVNLDYSSPLNYVKFSSFADLITKSIVNIINNYPASLYVQTNIVGRDYGVTNIISSQYNQGSDTTVLIIDTDYINNPANINILNQRIPSEKNFIDIFQNYELFYNSVKYPIIFFQGSQQLSNSEITITVKGKVFDDNNNIENQEFYISPSQGYLTGILDTFSGFERYLLNRFEIADVYESDGRKLLYKKYFNIPKIDSFNYDFYTDRYSNFLTELLELAKKYDEQDCNIILRQLIPQALIDESYTLDENDEVIPNKVFILSSFIGSYFDTLHEKIKIFYQGDKADNYNISNLYLKKYSGTRWQINKIFNKYNIPDSLVEFKQIVYGSNKINYSVLERVYKQYDIDIINQQLPINADGTPNVQNIKSIFQSRNYFKELDNLYPVDEDIYITTQNTETAEYVIFNDRENDNIDIINYQLTGLSLTNGSCFDVTGSVIESSHPEIFLDECGCPIDKTDYAFNFYLNPNNPYDLACPKFVLDVVPECTKNIITGETITGETICRFEYNLLSSDSIGNAVRIDPSLNGLSVSYKTLLSSTCQDQIQVDYNNVINIYTCYSIDNMSASGYVEQIRLFDTVNNTEVDVDISPTSPYLNGFYHTVDPNSLYFPSLFGEIETWEENVLKIIENAVYAQFNSLGSPQNGLNYFASVKYIDGSVEICFMNTHQATLPTYNIGINRNNARVEYSVGGVEYISTYNELYTDSVNIVHTRELCETLTLNKILYSEDILSRISVNYNEIIVNNNSVPVFDNGSYTITDCIVENIDNEFSIEYLINLNANIYGGTPPYTLYGIDEDTPYASGVIYTAFVEDANGCISNTVTGRTICQVDECDGFAYIERQRTTFIDVEIPATENCLPITLEYDFYIYSYTEDEEPQISQFYYSHSIPSSYPNDVTFYVTISVGLDTYTITTNQRIYYEVIDAGSPFIGAGDYTVSVYMVSSDGCLYELATHVFDLTSAYEGSISEVINASGSTETITVPSGIIETYIEYSPIRPVLGASYECNEDGTAILQITASGGYEPYVFFGGQNGQTVNSNQTLELFVRGSNGCESEHVFLNVVCEEPIVCEPIRLSASLETTSVTQQDSLATLTFSYLIEDDDISADVDEVNVVCTALNTASQYMIGNPVFASFNIEFGAKQLFFDFTPNEYIPVTIRFNMSIKMDNGCVYTDTFTLSVNPSILSSTDNYSKELIG